MKDNTPKFCKDCKHCTSPWLGRLPYDDPTRFMCKALPLPPDLVTSEVQLTQCQIARGENGPCGYEAILFEPKDK